MSNFFVTAIAYFIVIIVGLLFIAVIGFGPTYISSSFEANAFNKCTNSNVSAWDVMFVELRVDNCKK